MARDVKHVKCYVKHVALMKERCSRKLYLLVCTP